MYGSFGAYYAILDAGQGSAKPTNRIQAAGKMFLVWEIRLIECPCKGRYRRWYGSAHLVSTPKRFEIRIKVTIPTTHNLESAYPINLFLPRPLFPWSPNAAQKAVNGAQIPVMFS